jgi:hypothetical protein
MNSSTAFLAEPSNPGLNPFRNVSDVKLRMGKTVAIFVSAVFVGVNATALLQPSSTLTASTGTKTTLNTMKGLVMSPAAANLGYGVNH